jgi:hypothetical protein
MGLIPPTINGKIELFQSKVAPWTSNAAAIGTSPTIVSDMAAKVTACNTKLAAAVAAREASKNATNDLHLAVRDLVTAGSDILKSIRAKAAQDGDGVYVLAQIPPPATPGPVPAPGTPTDFAVAIRGDGSLALKWKCPNPPGSAGTIYQVSRQLGADGAFVMIGASGSRQFIDATLPAGAGNGPVTYQIVAIRSTAAGAPAQFLVRFGVGGGGSVTASVVSAPKLAA